jgi:hypothetical protein
MQRQSDLKPFDFRDGDRERLMSALRKHWLISLLFAVFFALLVAWVTSTIPHYVNDCTYRYETYVKECAPKHLLLFILRETFVLIENNDKIIGVLSALAVAAFTCTLWWSTRGLWRVTSATLSHAEKTAIRQLRAYISVKEILMEEFRHPDKPTTYAGITQQGDVHHYRMSTVMENGGPTPTRKAIINVNHELRESAIGLDFTFPDGKLSEAAAIGPGGTFGTPGFFISVDDVRKIVAKSKKLYVWGWIDYNDVFDDTPRHRMEFCFDISPDEVPNGGKIYMRFPMHSQFNGIDGDCLRLPSPYEKSGK